MVTAAFGITAPALSLTVPEMRPETVCPCRLRVAQIINKIIEPILITAEWCDHDLPELRI
jgi:hypothetical protein